MKELRYTLLSDGSSDKVLIPILTWLLREHRVTCPIQSEWADLGRLPKPPKDLSERIRRSLDLYPCDLLFVHRDAETQPLRVRVEEIKKAIDVVIKDIQWDSEVTICVVPVRMTEAWLLLDELALRLAAGNPSGEKRLELPAPNKLEQMPDPKNRLYTLLRQASGLSGHRLKKFRAHVAARLIPSFIQDFSPLRVLPAFQALEKEIRGVVVGQGWLGEPGVDDESS